MEEIPNYQDEKVIYIEDPLGNKTQSIRVFSQKSAQRPKPLLKKEKYSTKSQPFNFRIQKKRTYQKLEESESESFQSNVILAKQSQIDAIRDEIEKMENNINQQSKQLKKMEDKIGKKTTQVQYYIERKEESLRHVNRQRVVKDNYAQLITVSKKDDPRYDQLKKTFTVHNQAFLKQLATFNMLQDHYFLFYNSLEKMQQQSDKLDRSIRGLVKQKDQLKMHLQKLNSQLKAYELLPIKSSLKGTHMI